MSAPTVAQSTVDTQSYEPFTGFDAVLSGDPDAKVAWLRTESGGEGVLFAGMFTAEPSVFRYTFGGDESFHLLDGSLTIEVDGGDTVEVNPGDVVSFSKGSVSTWTIHQPMKKFFVISG
jgi:uncharacterized cupin superfamily protein